MSHKEMEFSGKQEMIGTFKKGRINAVFSLASKRVTRHPEGVFEGFGHEPGGVARCLFPPAFDLSSLFNCVTLGLGAVGFGYYPRRLSPGEPFFVLSPLSWSFWGFRRCKTAEGRETKLAEGSYLSPLPPGILQFSRPLFELPPSLIRMLMLMPPLISISDTILRLAEKTGSGVFMGLWGKTGERFSPRPLLSYP